MAVINLISPEIKPSAVLVADTGLFVAPLSAANNYLPVTNLGTYLGSGTLPTSLTQVIPAGTITPVTVSAAFEINSVSGGFLPPRMTLQQRNMLTVTEGMQVFVTTDNGTVVNKYNFYQSGAWVVLPSGESTGNVSFIGVPPVGQFNVPFFADTTGLNILDSGMTINQGAFEIAAVANLVLGNQLTNISSIDFVTSGNNNNDVTIGISSTLLGSQIAKIFLSNSGISSIVFSNSNVTTPSSPSAVVEIQSNAFAPACFLNARMTTAQMNALTSPQDGMQTYVIDGTPGLYLRESGTWTLLESTVNEPFPYRESGNPISLYMGTGYNTASNGTGNLGIGESALLNLNNGNHNIGIGYGAGFNVNNSSRNVFLGYNAGSGFLSTANDCIFIGNAGVFNPTLSNSVGIGGPLNGGVSTVLVSDSNQCIIGAPDGSPQISSLAYHVGIGTNQPYARLHVEGGIIYKVTNVSNSYSIPANDLGPNGGYSAYIIGVARSSVATGPYTIVLPASNNIQGQMFIIKDINGFTGNNIVVSVDASGPGIGIDGNATKTISSPWGYLMVYSNAFGQYVSVSSYGVTNSTFILAIRDVTTDTIVLPGDYVINVTDTSAVRTITLPPAALVGESFVVKDGSGQASINNIVIEPSAVPPGQLIDGQSSVSISTNYGSFNFVSDGTNYYII